MEKDTAHMHVPEVVPGTGESNVDYRADTPSWSSIKMAGIQLTMVAFVCFLCPGMFNALGGLGGGGKSDPTLADNMNTALYSTFAGKYFGTFWAVFNFGAVLGALIPLGQNINVKTNSTVNDAPILEIRVHRSLRHHRPRTSHHSSLPMFWASNWFYTYQQNGMNAAVFNTRTRALNNVLYWSAQIIGALIFGFGLDAGNFRRSVRAKSALAFLFVITMVTWGGGYAFEQTYTRESTNTVTGDYVPVDWTAGGKNYIGPMFLYIFYGFFDSAWQGCVYWFMGALSNSGRKSANYDTVTVEEDLKGTDETLSDVVPEGHAEKMDGGHELKAHGNHDRSDTV
ncbi:hypothetical protein DID88_002141 [Monilinia fructigena]|uniref:Uncharacterized protein n=1 Tax=Monilinia fructigena TaxID=38457 RepID=A0A395J0V3_9HELO|nr:hypothetical protein DID88_002141 [Monilinia fructigena]